MGGISQPCPAVVNYVEKYIPELIPHLVPIHSPMMCTAIYMQKYMNVTDRIAFISPCIAKKIEITDSNCDGYVSYNVTFDKLMKKIGREYEKCEPYTDELEYGLGSLYPMPGGLKENVEYFLGKELPFMVDILNCAKGCIYGTATEAERNTDDVMLTLAKLRSAKVSNIADRTKTGRKVKSKSPWAEALPKEERLKNLMQEFSALNIEDFMRQYSNRKVEIKEPDARREAQIYADMKKASYEEQNRDCECCGYDSCKNMVKAIHNDVNMKENCVYYIRSVAEEEAENLARIREKEQEEQRIHAQKLEEIAEEFAELNSNIAELNEANEMSADEATQLAQYSQHYDCFGFCPAGVNYVRGSQTRTEGNEEYYGAVRTDREGSQAAPVR